MASQLHFREPLKSLNGQWELKIDSSDCGEENRWFDPESDWKDSRNVSVPHSWQEESDLRDYTGAAWYRRTFTVDFDNEGLLERVFLTFGAVDYQATIWLNGTRIGKNTGGYLPFDVEATDAIKDGKNTITMRVSDPADLSEIPHGKQGDPWYTRVSGPWQRVSLVSVSETFVEDIQITPDLDKDSVTVDLSICDPADQDLLISIKRNNNTISEKSTHVDDLVSVEMEIPNANYWTPEDPTLYDVDVSLYEGDEMVDTYSDYFGMRSISFEDGQLYLNEEPFMMRGALDQAFYPETYYRPQNLETFEQEIRTAKDLGFNLLRKHIKPAHPKFLELADRLGILVWEEPANPTAYTDRSKSEVRNQLKGLINRDYNRPSVIIWSLYNEEWGIGGHEDEEPLWTDTDKQDYLESLYEETLDWDSTRLICDNSGWAHVATDINDYHEYFIAPDRVDAWQERLDHITENPSDNYGDARRNTDVPIIISEFGTWGMSDISDLLDYYNEEPHWFNHDFLSGLKRPSSVLDRFEDSHASDTFDSISEFTTTWQQREYQSVARLISDMRKHDRISGYVITELTDIEWEFNGILDYLRQEKSFYEDFARVNSSIMPDLDVESYVVWDDEIFKSDIFIVNDTNDRLQDTVEWSAFGKTESFEINIGPNEVARYEDAISVSIPNIDQIQTVTVAVTMRNSSRSVSKEISIVSRDYGERAQTVFAENDQLQDELDQLGYEIIADPREADVAIVSDPDGYEQSNLLVIPEMTGEMAKTISLDYIELPKKESWNLCASLIYQDLLPEIETLPSWAFDGLYPYTYISNTSEDDSVFAGYVEGWVQNEGALALTRSDGDIAGACTLRLMDKYGNHPIGTVILDRLVEMVDKAAQETEPLSSSHD